MKISWNGFSKKSYQERLELLKAQALLSPERQESLEQDEQMSVTVADQLSENVVGTFSLPYSLVPEVLVNGQDYTVPYVTEEPSVVAAASYASKIIKRAGGFTAQVHERQMIGQVALYQVADPEQAQEKIASKKAELLELANQAYPSIVKRGGGARDLHVEQIKGETDFLVVYLHVDTQEAMGVPHEPEDRGESYRGHRDQQPGPEFVQMVDQRHRAVRVGSAFAASGVERNAHVAPG